MLVISDMNNLHSSLINEERLRLGTGRENTNIERCTESLSRAEKKTSRKIKWTWNSQSKYKDTKGRKTPAFRHLEYTCLIILMWQNALRKQKFLHPTHAPLSQRCVLIINGLGSRPVWGKKVRNNQKKKSNKPFPPGSLPVLCLWNLPMKTALHICSKPQVYPPREI